MLGFAHALGLLYDNELRVKEDEVADVLAAANLIEYSALEEKQANRKTLELKVDLLL